VKPGTAPQRADRVANVLPECVESGAVHLKDLLPYQSGVAELSHRSPPRFDRGHAARHILFRLCFDVKLDFA